ncbi:hypothetical protein [Pseudotabrizicola algicola]|uniref:Uncharacterized protein n=1 Tax=Pseudotabrizicola algicola TaxID=2709381 RepID=A0A6B3RPM7_9RHOB|nr:hypothetical protein [Pseudotabrizicola algicola]NEX48124.1 hypothetical protein [Pseudotabrizicola algicola]
MFNPLPLLALGAVAIGYFGAIDRTNRAFDAAQISPVAAFPATPGLSVHDFVAKLPQTVQDPLCDNKDVITASLAHDFAEGFHAEWLEHQAKVELWTSDVMGTWTLLHVGSDGLACIVGSGFGWSEGMEARDILPDNPLS